MAEVSGLTVSEARVAIALDDVRQAAPADADPLDALEAEFLAAETSGRLAQAVRQAVQSKRRQVVSQARTHLEHRRNDGPGDDQA